MVTRAYGAWNWKTPLGQRSGPFWKVGPSEVGLGCGGDEGVGPTLVAYLRGAGVGTVEATTAAAVVGMAGAF